MTKLESYSRNFIAALPINEFERRIRLSASDQLVESLDKDRIYTQKVLEIERFGDKPRKDLAKFSDAYEHYGYFFDDIYKEDFAKRIDSELDSIDSHGIESSLSRYLSDYNYGDTSDKWLEKVRAGAEAVGLHMRDYTKVIRVKLTGKSHTPDLWTIQQVMGEARVENRLN